MANIFSHPDHTHLSQLPLLLCFSKRSIEELVRASYARDDMVSYIFYDPLSFHHRTPEVTTHHT